MSLRAAALALALLGTQEGPTEAELSLKKLRPADGLKVGLFASEPGIANVSSFCIDAKGRFFVVETHRRRTSVIDIRTRIAWLDEDLACRTVEDRAAMLRRHLGTDVAKLAVESEKIKLVEDRDGDGRAERSETFAEGFNSILDGVAAGILARDDRVWFANIPNLWLLRDADGDGKAEERKVLHHGFGIRQALGGHDFHGLVLGPDGRLYMSIGDRGLHVKTPERGVVAVPDSGAVLRCDPDGSNLELYATGLRNPQELAFDALGNLWTGDNNANVGADNGETARWVHVVEGGDSAWRIGYQHLPSGGPWTREDLWKGGAAYAVPPAGHLGHGPAGMAFYPGTGLPEKYRDHFFLCDFPGGVYSFAVKPKGASYELADVDRFLWELYPTDVAFGPAGGAYVSDWVQGFEKTDKGRIFHVLDPAAAADPAVQEVREILAGGLAGRTPQGLARLLGHRDQRVRLEAQFELVKRLHLGILLEQAQKGETLLGRLHAMWGLGQLQRSRPAAEAMDGLVRVCLADPEPEVRAQAAKVLGEARFGVAKLLPLLKDPSPRVRYQAAMALGRSGLKEAVGPLLAMIRENADRDAFLRHAGVTALAGIGDAEALVSAGSVPDAAVRRAALLALRRMGRPELSAFLADEDPEIVFEAARAIHDVPIPDAMPALAGMLEGRCPEKALLRAVNANFRLGRAGALAAFARREGGLAAVRAEALRALAEWEHPSGRDKVMGVWRPVPARDAQEAREALLPGIAELLAKAPLEVRVAAAEAAGALRIVKAAPVLRELAGPGPVPVRVEALKALAALEDPGLGEAVRAALVETDVTLRREVIRLIPRAKLPGAAALLEKAATEEGPASVRQAAVLALSEGEAGEADAALERLLDRLLAGTWPAPLQLELLEASAKRLAPGVRERAARHEASQKEKGPLSPWRESLEGGDPEPGKQLFFVRVHASCSRCHKVGDEGGTAGPPLTTIGAQRTREQLLESMVFPSREISPGYEHVLILTEGGAVEAGRVLKETESEIEVLGPDGLAKAIPKGRIKQAKRGLSAMPDDLARLLTKRELRDLVEFMARLK